jgi:hypothetical protein
VADVEDQIVAAGAQIIWVMEQAPNNAPGTADNCYDFMNLQGSTKGWCVGDSQTQPVPGVFDDSPFSIARGFDILVTRSTMVVEFSTNHGTTGGNENITGAELLAEVQALAGQP